MSDSPQEDPRGIESRGVPKPRKLVDPQTSSRLDAERYRSITRRYLIHPDGPNTLEDIERSNRAHEELLEERHVWRFQRPNDGSIVETSWKGIGTASQAEALADIAGLKLLGELRREDTPLSESPALPPRRRVQAPPAKPAPPRKAKAPRPLPPGITPAERGIKDSRPTVKDRIGGSPPPTRPPTAPVRPRAPIRVERESLGHQIKDYFESGEFTHTTMTQSLPLISTWFGRVGDVLEKIPPLEGFGKAYKLVAEIADAMNLLYELYHEMSQAEALEKGGKEVIKRTQPARVVAEILARKYPKMPEQVRKAIAKKLEDVFERYVSDPAIKKGRESMEKMDKDKELQRPLYQEMRSIQKMIRDSVLFR
jgi:hypothetical protein